MPPAKKRQKLYEQQSRTSDGSAEEWGNDDDSEIDLEKEKEAQSKFMMAKLGNYGYTKETPRSTYYDKWGPSGSFTRSAIGTSKITNFFSTQSNTDDEIINLDHDIVDESEQSESEEENLYDVNIDVKLKFLKEELENQHNKMKVDEYNKKRAIFEYLKLLNKNGSGKMKASLSIAQIIFIDGRIWKARQIRHWSNYWLLHNALPISFQGKH
ncbi:unnamed protein product [Rhizophagus irregularis]|nr:unnamed protein product [Rhizophagus irregularis]